MKLYLYKPGYVTTSQELPFADYAALKPRIVHLLDGGTPEHVAVLWRNPATNKDQRADMFVNEDGHALELPINQLATNIYWASAVARGLTPHPSWAVIVGPAVVFDRPVWS